MALITQRLASFLNCETIIAKVFSKSSSQLPLQSDSSVRSVSLFERIIVGKESVSLSSRVSSNNLPFPYGHSVSVLSMIFYDVL